jgi:hypothetical protein
MVQPRLQHGKRRIFVPVLASLRLTADNDAGGNMSDANSGGGFVDVLTTSPGGTESVNAYVVFFDFDIQITLNYGIDMNLCKRCMPSGIGVKGRYTNQSVNP